MKFIAGEPRNPATYWVAGRSYRSSGALLLDAAVAHQHDAIGHRHRLIWSWVT
jgi:hypothetical protein